MAAGELHPPLLYPDRTPADRTPGDLALSGNDPVAAPERVRRFPRRHFGVDRPSVALDHVAGASGHRGAVLARLAEPGAQSAAVVTLICRHLGKDLFYNNE